jgi:hypothetical protein
VKSVGTPDSLIVSCAKACLEYSNSFSVHNVLFSSHNFNNFEAQKLTNSKTI